MDTIHIGGLDLSSKPDIVYGSYRLSRMTSGIEPLFGEPHRRKALEMIVPDTKTGLNSVADIPKAWRNALEVIQLFYPDAVMAGGCLRDRENGVAVKDIDIFVSAQESKICDADRVVDVLTKEGWRDVKLLDHTVYMEGCDTRVIGVVEARYVGCPPVQIVIGEWDMANLWDHFDFGICQIKFDGRKIERSQNYTHDRLSQQFRVVTQRSDEAFVATINRWARLKEKYPTWKFNLGTRAQTGYATGGYVDKSMNPTRMTFSGINNSAQARAQAALRMHRSGVIYDQTEADVLKAISSTGEAVLPKSAATTILQRVPSANIVRTDHRPGGRVTVTVGVQVQDRSTMMRELMELVRRDPGLLRK